MYVLGVHDGHNASAVLVRDGRVIAGVQEERPRGVKNAIGLPRTAIQDVLSQAGLTPGDVDWVALSGLHSGEYLKIDQSIGPAELTIRRHQAIYEQSAINLKRLVRRLIPDCLYESLRGDWMRQQRVNGVASLGFDRQRIRLVEHHTAHAASAYYGWGKFDEPVLILTNDGMGDNVCATVSVGHHGRFERIAEVPYTESVGEIYALTTFLLGMVPLEHEYKLMGMAPYASPRQAEKVCADLARLIEFGSGGGVIWHRRNGVPPLSSAHRYLERLYTRQRFDHVCGGLQKFVEDFLVRWVRNAIAYTGLRKVALSGGIFMNVKANKLLLEMDEVEDLFVFPSCGDETNAVGAAYWVYAEERRKRGQVIDIEPISDLYWSRDFTDDEIEQAILGFAFSKKVRIETPRDIERRVAELLSDGQVVARCSGRMEFGARALGNRSILANAADARVIKTINDMIKKRDFWMPFAPSVTVERVRDYVVKPKNVPAPYMIFTFDSVPKKIPVFAAAVHPYDGTARPQEVMQDHNPRFHRLIQYYGEMTGEEIILNTSFNIHGLPIAYTPEQALSTLEKSGLQHLAIGGFLVTKEGTD
jgi:carbamoyltransferase